MDNFLSLFLYVYQKSLKHLNLGFELNLVLSTKALFKYVSCACCEFTKVILLTKTGEKCLYLSFQKGLIEH